MTVSRASQSSVGTYSDAARDSDAAGDAVGAGGGDGTATSMGADVAG